MKTTAEIVEILRDYKALSSEKYGIETLGLFGSVARGEQNKNPDNRRDAKADRCRNRGEVAA